MKHVFLILVLLLPLLGACIRIEPRKANPDANPAPAEKAKKAPEKTPPSARAFLLKIERGEIRWEDISRYPAPEQLWREERFRLIRPRGDLRTSDFSLIKVQNLPGRRQRLIFSFLPLRTVFDGKTAWDTQVVFEPGREDEIANVRMQSALIPLQINRGLRLSGAECGSISITVLKALFKQQLPEKVRASERFRFCFPVNGSDQKFHDHLHPRARIPELDPYEEYPDFPIPFEKGRYRAFSHGAFYYYAGIVLPVTDQEVWVFDSAILYAGGQTSGMFFKLKKGLIFWEIVSEGSYDAPSRAVKEKEEP